MADPEREQEAFLQQALTTIKSPIGLVVVAFAILSQIFNAFITLVSSGKEYANPILIAFGATLVFMIIVLVIAVIYDLKKGRQVLDNELKIERYQSTIRQKTREIKQLKGQLAERD